MITEFLSFPIHLIDHSMIRLQSIFPNYSTTTGNFSEFFQVPICWIWQVLKLTYFAQEEVSLFHEATKGWAEEKVWFWKKITFVLITWMFLCKSCQWNFLSGSEHDSRPPGNWSLKEDGAIKFFAKIQIFRPVLGSHWLEELSSIVFK